MSVENLFFSSRDGKEKALADPQNKTFSTQKEAQERDRYLELIEELTYFVSERLKGVDEQTIEQVSEVIAANKDQVAKGLKKPQSLNEVDAQTQSSKAGAKSPEDSNVAAIGG